MEQITCECGHVNPGGTVFCGKCGKPFQQESFDMRYEGSARRSITSKKTIIDKIWVFFSSVKVGVWLIVITLIASAIGTIFPQQMYLPPNVTPADYYAEQYGALGTLYFKLGFNNLYGSWWYMVLIAAIGASIIIASIDRGIPLYKALKKQGVTRHIGFLKRQRLLSVSEATEQELEAVKVQLKKRRYHVRTENGNILAEKGRFSRWGPYVNHVGLIIFLFGAMLRFVPGMYIDEVLWLREGETKEVPGTNGQYYLKNEKFIKEVYDKSKEDKAYDAAITRVGDNMIPKNYQTNSVLYKVVGKTKDGEKPALEKVKDYKIRVNEPLEIDQYALYQVDYKEGELSKMFLNLEKKDGQQKWGPITLSLDNPEEKYDLGNGKRVELLNYFPDFFFDESGKPSTKTKLPNNPAFVFKMYTPETPEGEVSFVAIRQNIEAEGKNKYKMTFAGIETRNATGLTVRKDLTLWILALGGAIFMIGVIQGMYWNHRRIWLQRVDGKLFVAGHTNKNWYGLRNELTKVLQGTNIAVPIDTANEKNK